MYAGPAGRVAFLVGLIFGRIFGVKVWAGLLRGRIVGLRQMVGLVVGAALHCGRRSWIARSFVEDGQAFLRRMSHMVGLSLGVRVAQRLLHWWWCWGCLTLRPPQKW
jgi:hypothetical protein